MSLVEQGQLVTPDVTAEETIERIGQAVAIAFKPDSSALLQEHINQPESQLQLVTLSSIPLQARVSKKSHTERRVSARSFQEGLGRKKKKKLDSIVKSEKELRFNPKKSVKKWLESVEP